MSYDVHLKWDLAVALASIAQLESELTKEREKSDRLARAIEAARDWLKHNANGGGIIETIDAALAKETP